MADLRWHKTVGPLEITKLSVGRMDNNVYLLAAGQEVLLIDGSSEAEAILAQAGRGELKTIVQTHGHPDHIAALPDLVKRTSARVLAHQADARRMPVDVELVDEGDTVEVGGARLDVLHTPGHTPGSICLILRDGAETHLFAGDTLFPGGPGATFGDKQAFEIIMHSLEEKLFVLPDATHVYPGHGADTTIGAERGSVPEWKARGW